MRNILNIARLHMTLQLKSRSIWITAFVVPLILSVVLALANQDSPVQVRLDVLDQDQSESSAQLIEQLRSSGEVTGGLIICLYGSPDLPDDCNLAHDADFEDVYQTRIEEGTVDAALVIPENFDEQLAAGETAELLYYSNNQLNAPTLAQTVVQSATNQIASSVIIARVGTETAVEAGFDIDETDYAALREQAQIALQTPPAIVDAESTGEEVGVGFGAGQSVPGMATMFTMFSMLGLASLMVVERQQGTLQRLFTLPAPKSSIIAGKILGAFIFGVFQMTVFVVVGSLLGIDWGGNYLAIAAIIGAYCLAGTALGFVLATLVRTDAQAVGLSNLLALTLAPLGGAWWPLEIVPETMQTIGHISPIAWAMDGFHAIIWNDQGLLDILFPEVTALLVMAGLFFMFAVWRFRYE